MPQPKEVISYSLGAHYVYEAAPKFVTQMGRVALHWTKVEEQLMSTVSSIMGTSWPNPDGNGWSMTHNQLVSISLRETETIRGRLKLVDAFIGEATKRFGLESQWSKLERRIRDCGRSRNIVLHTNWGFDDSLPEWVIRPGEGTKCEGWRVSDLVAICDRCTAIERDLVTFTKTFLNAAGAKRPNFEAGEVPRPKLGRF